MALFSTKRSALQTLASSGWSDTAQRDQLLAELRKAPPKAGELTPLLWHPDAELRKTAAALFLPRAEEADVKKLLQELLAKSPQVRTALLPLLARLPAPALRGALEELLTKGEPQARRLAWETALALPDPARRPYVQRAIFDAPTVLRIRALQDLVATGDVQAHVDTLLKLATDADGEIAAAALKALAGVQHPKVLPLMLERLAEGDEATRAVADRYVRTAAQTDGEGMRQALLDMLTRGSDESRRIAVEILMESLGPDEAVPQILEHSNRIAGWMRARIVEALRGRGEPVLRAAARLMQSPDEAVRTNAIMMLAEGFDDRRLVEPFCRVLADPDWWLRVTACQVLGRLGDERAVPALVRTLQDEDTRWAAVDALAQIGAPSALQPLSQLLRDPRQEVRLEVLQAFSRFQDPRLVKVLEAVQQRDPSGEVRLRAGEVMAELAEKLGQGEAAATLSGAAERTDPGNLQSPVDKLLLEARRLGVSDLHLSVGEPPLIRLHGVLERLEAAAPLSAEQIHQMVLALLDDEQRRQLDEHGSLDFSYETPEVGRFRANAYVQRLGTCASFRLIPERPPTLRELGLPPQLKELLDYHQGLIIISGPSGSGKSTTLTALVNIINETKPVHILTLEDPIELVHPPKLALVNQRQVGRDTETFARGLRAALREDPDVVVVGELRDPESVRLALEAAETGHVVIATLHTASAVQTIDRLVGSFPADEQAQVRIALSESLKFVVCQRLVPNKAGDGRVAVFEVLKGTLSIANMIRKNETFQIPGLMQIGRHLGMRTLDQALQEMVEGERIRPETAWEIADKPETFAHLCDPAELERLETLE